MTEPGHHGPPPPRAEVCETHTAIVFFAGDRAYKVKKPVDLGFLDYTTRRRAGQRASAKSLSTAASPPTSIWAWASSAARTPKAPSPSW